MAEVLIAKLPLDGTGPLKGPWPKRWDYEGVAWEVTLDASILVNPPPGKSHETKVTIDRRNGERPSLTVVTAEESSFLAALLAGGQFKTPTSQ